MKVYLLSRITCVYGHLEHPLVRVYSTLEKAEKALKELEATKGSEYSQFISNSIDEIELDSDEFIYI